MMLSTETTEHIKQAILDLIHDIVRADFIGRIEVMSPYKGCIKTSIYLDSTPTIILAELEPEKYIKFVREDLRTRNFHLNKYAELQKRIKPSNRKET